MVHNVTFCSTVVVLPSYEKNICNLQLHFYFSLLCSFRITSFRIPLELFPFVMLFFEAAGASAAPDGLRSGIVS